VRPRSALPSVAATASHDGGGAEDPGSAVILTPTDTLARVNGVAIRATDILAFTGKTQMEMSHESLEDLVRRAIERELISQAAKAQGVELSTAQHAELDAARRHTVEKREIKDPAALAIEMKQIESELLQTALLEKQGGVRTQPTPDDVQRYYDEHRSEFGALPAEGPQRDQQWKSIDIKIRGELATSMQQDYHDKLRRYLDQLAAAAKISRDM
jgi:hypothetical protein